MKYKTCLSFVLALGLTVVFSGLASADCSESYCALVSPPIVQPSAVTGPAISLTYAQLLSGAAVYANPADAAAGHAPINWLAPGFVFVALANATPVIAGNQKWYALYQGGYISAAALLLYPPSEFQGVQLSAQPDKPMAWVVADSPISNSPGAQPPKDAPIFSTYARVTIMNQQAVGGVTWYQVGEQEWLSQYRVGVVSVTQRPDAIGPTDKWIEVNLYEQTLAAYEGDRMVYATLVASGLPQWPTTPGLFKIYDKVKMDKMSGDDGQPDYYYLQDIPWIMYFNNDQALHTAYWHDAFGAPHSHGCVNLAPADALWLFNWTTPNAGSNNHTMATDNNQGTWVWVHY